MGGRYGKYGENKRRMRLRCVIGDRSLNPAGRPKGKKRRRPGTEQGQQPFFLNRFKKKGAEPTG